MPNIRWATFGPTSASSERANCRLLRKTFEWTVKQTPTDLKRLAGIIKQSGYRGYLPLETLGPGDPYVKVPALLEKARRDGLF